MTTNKVSGQVALPAAGEGACLQFTTDSFERLESEYADKAPDGDYINYIVGRLAKCSIPVYRVVLDAILVGGDAKAMPWGCTIESINIPILDALYLALNGRTYEEQIKWNEEQMLKRLSGLEENPQLAELLRGLSLKNAGASGSEQG